MKITKVTFEKLAHGRYRGIPDQSPLKMWVDIDVLPNPDNPGHKVVMLMIRLDDIGTFKDLAQLTDWFIEPPNLASFIEQALDYLDLYCLETCWLLRQQRTSDCYTIHFIVYEWNPQNISIYNIEVQEDDAETRAFLSRVLVGTPLENELAWLEPQPSINRHNRIYISDFWKRMQ